MNKNKQIKIFSIIGLISLFFSIFAILPKKAQALAPTDQVCSTGVAGTQGYTFLSHEPYQVFVPEKNMLDAVEVYIKADAVQSATVSLSVINVTNDPVQTIATKARNITDEWSWVLFDVSDVSMPLGMYVIGIKNIAGHAVWKHGPANCYARGYAVYNNTEHIEFDYGFAVYAYNEENPSGQEPSDSDSSSTNSQGSSSNPFSGGTSAGSGQAPSATISSSINPPGNLKAKDVPFDNGGKILLTWLPSTSKNIDGYKVFRSKSRDSGFKEIARTAAIVGGYIDQKATTGTTYYYIVRAYRGASESKNSNIASTKSFDDLGDILRDARESRDASNTARTRGIIIAIIIIAALVFFFAIIAAIAAYFIFFHKKKT